MRQKYFCEYCGKTFNSPLGPSICSSLTVCRGMNNPPVAVIGTFKVRACAVILARTAGDMLSRSPAARSCVKTQKMGQRIVDWSDRAYKALEANTPISLGCASKIQVGLSQFVSAKLWTNRQGVPNRYLLELASMYADAAKNFVEERIEKGIHVNFWFEDEHKTWLAYDAVSAPLAIYISKLKTRRQTSKELDYLIVGYGERRPDRAPGSVILKKMLDHCWRDELRSWRFLEGALDTAAKHIEKHGTAKSNDLKKFDPTEAYQVLFDYIWGDEEALQRGKKPEPNKKLKAWLVGDRFWVAATSRSEARVVLREDTGHVAKKVIGVSPEKKLFDKRGRPAGTVADMLRGLDRPQFIGVE